MDAFVLLFTLAILLALGMPVAFAVGLSAVAGALWIDLPLEALMIQITSGVNKFTLLAIPFFILAGAIMAEGALPDGWSTSRTFCRLYSRRAVAGEHRGINVLRRDFRLVGGGYGVYRQRDDPGDGEEGLSARIRGGGDGQRVGAGDPDPAQPQLGDLLPGGRGTVSIATLFIAGVLPGLLLGVSLMVLCLCFARKRGYPKGTKSRSGRR